MDTPASKPKTRILIILLIGIAAFSLTQYLITTKEKELALTSLGEARTRLTTLEGVSTVLKDELNRELRLKEKILEQKTEAESSLKEKTEAIAQLEASIAQLQLENSDLGGKVTKLSGEKVNLEARLHSVAELKKAIMELRKEMVRVSRAARRKIEVESITKEGNRGYILKSGRPTFPKNKVEVTPVP